MDLENIVIKKFTKRDVSPFLLMCQKIFENTYANTSLGYPAHLFQPKHFFTDEMQEYFDEIMVNKTKNRGLVAKNGTDIVGGIAIREFEAHYEVKGFYVADNFQGKGVGKRLWQELTKKINPHKPIELGVFAHNSKSIAMYKKWGFRMCPKEEWGVIHWSTWPKKYVLPLAKMRKDGLK